ncbi:MAG TPA: metalloregulator ArsR/SmtB family transcription factor [Planctomycetota bacterium]|nr:metalloregulator ArsR/SmtB family transcription factor [Planctomycetota bacterium]
MQPTAGEAPEELFGLLADRTRLRILALLAGAEVGPRGVCVGDLVEALDLPQPTVSRHLGHLRRAGWLVASRREPWVHYTLAPDAAGGRLGQFLELCGEPEFERDRWRLGRLVESGGCCPP